MRICTIVTRVHAGHVHSFTIRTFYEYPKGGLIKHFNNSLDLTVWESDLAGSDKIEL